MKPKVTLLLPFWEDASIVRFGQFGLLSLLAEGNLPALAAATDFEFCLLSTTTGLAAFDALPASRILRDTVTVRTIAVDDLVLDFAFAVTPTLAFLRGIQMAPDPTGTHFLFWDPDFVVADGSLQRIARRIGRSQSVLLASVVHVDAAQFAGRLNAKPCSGSRTVLQLAPRDLVRTALASLHPLEVGAIVNGTLPLSARSEHLSWRVDDATMIRRDFASRLLCMKPDRVVDRVSALHDVSFAPKMCPAATPAALTDSDELFIVRMQVRDSLQEEMTFGRPTLEDTARDLATWVTREQCDQAERHAYTIRARELPASAARVAEQANDFVRQLAALLAPTLKSHDNHPHWLVAHYLWSLRKFELHGGTPPKSPFLPGTQAGQAGRLRGAVVRRSVVQPRRLGRLRRRLTRVIFGEVPFVRMWHPDWLDYRPLVQALRPLFRDASPTCLHVADNGGRFSSIVGAPTATPSELLYAEDASTDLLPTGVDVAFIDLEEHHLPELSALIARVHPRVRPGGTIIAFYKQAGAGTNSDLSQMMVRTLLALPLSSTLSVAFAGGEQKRWLRQEFSIIPSYLRSLRPQRLVRGIFISINLMLKTVQLNRRMAKSQDARINVGPWSSFVVTIVV